MIQALSVELESFTKHQYCGPEPSTLYSVLLLEVTN